MFVIRLNLVTRRGAASPLRRHRPSGANTCRWRVASASAGRSRIRNVLDARRANNRDAQRTPSHRPVRWEWAAAHPRRDQRMSRRLEAAQSTIHGHESLRPN